MALRPGHALTVTLLSLLIVALYACTAEEYPAWLWAAQHPGTPDASTATAPDVQADLGPGTCAMATAQPLPQRIGVRSTSVQTPSTVLVTQASLFETFNTYCGPCHGPSLSTGNGNFQITNPVQFGTAMDQTVLDHIMSDAATNPADLLHDPKDPMPPFSNPNGRPWSSRPKTDPIYQFVQLVEAWINAKKPDSFPDPNSSKSQTDDSRPFLLSVSSGDGMTNLGSCIPDKALVSHAAKLKKAAELDALFAGEKKAAMGSGTPAEILGLPAELEQTDLFTFDTATLASYGVIAFQPAYPLWSDDAGKLRMVRVPLGQSIHFDAARQEFDIPENTRFYKTFMKRIVDTDGSYRWKKVETRLIVARQDTPRADGTSEVNALFGTYRWDDDEMHAHLVTTPLNSGYPFGDQLFLYHTDEQLAASIAAQNPPNLDEALVAGGAAQHYALPSSERCVECHMGSPSASFVLGFRPVEIKRRPTGEGGTIVEPGQVPPTADELSQLQRLIDYGVITGVDSPDAILNLEDSEGTRKPRDDPDHQGYELRAQGYMVGNCAHCHNPRGYPSVEFPVLKDQLSFLPGPNGGIFQFSLEKYSPRITRGTDGSTLIPYIAPSLVDTVQKTVGFGDSTGGKPWGVYAPWRSLIYRNVDTPFTYTTAQPGPADQETPLYPHMPMNTPGYDCRVRQIMSDWMVSIPALRKSTVHAEYPPTGAPLDTIPQNYAEVAPGAPGYDDAVAAAKARLEILHTGVNPAFTNDKPYVRYYDCPSNQDILDPQVVDDPTCHPIPRPAPVSDTDPSLAVMSSMQVPTHAHWVKTDLSVPDGPWVPRRPDWASALYEQKPSGGSSACSSSSTDAANAEKDVERAISTLQSATLDQIRDFATKPFAMGLWKDAGTCNFPTGSDSHVIAQPLASAITGGDRRTWMAHPDVHIGPSDHAYMEWPGAAVFNMICINCHGAKADVTGRLADNLLTMSGGSIRVADLRDGLFGPPGMPGTGRANVFSTLPTIPADAGVDADVSDWTAASVDDRAAKYLAWMGLGGTQKAIPQAMLAIVANTAVLGIKPEFPSSAISANMLAVAKAACTSLLWSNVGTSGSFAIEKVYTVQGAPYLGANKKLIATNGDAELWMQLCSIGNPPPVRAVHGGLDVANDAKIVVQFDSVLQKSWSSDLFPQSAYAGTSGYGVGDDNMVVVPDAKGSIPRSNLRPYCYRQGTAGPGQGPICPPTIDAAKDMNDEHGAEGYRNGFSTYTRCTNGCWGPEEADRWATRGAINAGFAVFLYLDALTKGTIQRVPDYDQCGQL